MDIIFSTNNKPNISEMVLKTPKPIQGGTYYSKIKLNENDIFIQTPKCKTKNGIHKTGKKIYCDLKFDNDQYAFIEILRDIENKVKKLIYEKRELWFHDEPSIEEIDYNWNTSIRTNRNNEYLVRTFVQKGKNNDYINLQIYDDDENILTIEDINENNKIISIMEIQGLKYTSQSFHLEVCMRQVMVIKDKKLFNKCLIQINNSKKKAEKHQKYLVKNNENNTNGENSEKTDGDVDLEETGEHLEETGEHLEETNENLEETNENLEETNENLEEISKKLNEKVIKIDKNLEEKEKKQIEEEDVVEGGIVTKNNNERISNVIGNIKEDDTHINNNNKKEILNDGDKDNLVKTNTDNEEMSEKKKTDNLGLTENINKDLEKLDIMKLKEFEFDSIEEDEPIQLKKRKDVYLEMYKRARKKAIETKKRAIKAFLEAKNIKETYLIDDIDSSDEELSEYEDILFSEN